jgi:hypothetical protein
VHAPLEEPLLQVGPILDVYITDINISHRDACVVRRASCVGFKRIKREQDKGTFDTTGHAQARKYA